MFIFYPISRILYSNLVLIELFFGYRLKFFNGSSLRRNPFTGKPVWTRPSLAICIFSCGFPGHRALFPGAGTPVPFFSGGENLLRKA
jgi:hypothetical protein